MELIRIEVPQLYETEVQRRKSESKQSEMLAKQREDDKLSIGHMILAPFALIIHLLLWLGKFLIMSFVTLLIFGVVSFSFSTIGFDLVGSTMGLILAAVSFIFMWKKYGSELF